jgi:hypothetical protein
MTMTNEEAEEWIRLKKEGQEMLARETGDGTT